ncbi:hypothetical protein BDZ97DRAFT_1758709, partial [Flammula alnicola]
MPRDNDEEAFLRTIPCGVLKDFRESKSLTKIDVYGSLPESESSQVFGHRLGKPRHPDASDAFIKRERDASPATLAPLGCASGYFRTSHEDGKELIEILSSDDEAETSDAVIKKERDISPILTPVRSSALFRTSLNDGKEVLELFSSDDEAVDFPKPDLDVGMSSDSDITSKVKLGSHRLNRQLCVNAIEYLSSRPSYWPVPHDKRAYVIDLSDEKYDQIFYDEDGEILSIDALIKDMDQDSWRGGTGEGDSRSTINIFAGEAIECRRSRL